MKSRLDQLLVAQLNPLAGIIEFLIVAGFTHIRDTPSPITGTDGNVEYTHRGTPAKYVLA